MSTTTARVATAMQTMDARYAPFIPTVTPMGRLRWRIAPVMLTLGQLQATLQMKQTLALPNAVPPIAAIRILKAVILKAVVAQNAQITPAPLVLMDLC